MVDSSMSTEERRIENVEGYRRDLLAIAERWRSAALAFRGRKDRDWMLEASAERRLKMGFKGLVSIRSNGHRQVALSFHNGFSFDA